jgi:hypothetical protein
LPEPDKAKVSTAAKDAINKKTAKYMVYHPEKDVWTPEDHAIRFIVTIVSDNMLNGLWSDSDWKKRNVEITKAVYEVMSYLRASEFGSQGPPPGYDASSMH